VISSLGIQRAATRQQGVSATTIDDESYMRRIFGSIYWHPTLLRALVAIICIAGVVWLVMEYFNPAPPSTITIATGPKGGANEFFAQQYQAKLARAHVRLDIRITEGTSENIRFLEDPKSGATASKRACTAAWSVWLITPYDFRRCTDGDPPEIFLVRGGL
jgi:hypothetical protein